MLRCEDRAGAARSVWSQTLIEQACLTEHGLVFGAGSVLARMTKGVGARLTVDADAERIVALMSVAAGRPLSADTVVPHVSAAAEHWRRGDKALAQFRLAVGRLPCLSCAADAVRMAIAEHILDAGVSPATLMAELWPDVCGGLAKTYDPEEPRDWRGWWAREDAAPDGSRPIQVAMDSGPPDEDEKHFHERDITGLATPEEEIAHGHGADPFGGLPGIGLGPFAGRSVPVARGQAITQPLREQVDTIGRNTGCHVCGSKDPGDGVKQFYCDHQPPTALSDASMQQRLYPHCRWCSCSQGGLVNQYKNR